MDSVEPKIKGVVSEVGLKRDEDQFSSFNLKIGVLLKHRKSLTYEQGEKMIGRFRKELLGKEIEITTIKVLCPICRKGFNTEQGMKRHVRMVHEKKKETRKRRKRVKRNPRKKSNSKQTT